VRVERIVRAGRDFRNCRRALSAGGFREVFFQHFSSLIDQLRLGVGEIEAKPAAVSNFVSQARDKIRFGVATN
jgi:hypothetical protein